MPVQALWRGESLFYVKYQVSGSVGGTMQNFSLRGNVLMLPEGMCLLCR